MAAILVGFLSIVLSGPLLNLAGHVDIPQSKVLHWENSAPLNNGACTINKVADACEDVVIHAASSTAFLACGDPAGRSAWFPPAGPHNVSGRLAVATFQEKLFTYDLATETTTELQLEGLEGDFVTHGLDVYSVDAETVHIFVVRHARDGESVSIFRHTLGSKTATFLKDVRHPLIKTPNDVAAAGPYEFYFTNDHYFYDGILRTLEQKFGPWSWATAAHYCDASSSSDAAQCKQVTPSQPGANGIAVWEDRLFVGDSKNATVSVFRLRPDKGADFETQVDLGAAADNIKIDPSTGDGLIAIFPSLEDIPHYLANVHRLGKDVLVPTAALRLVKANGYKPELIFYDNGGVLSDMTAMALDPERNVLIGAAVFQYGGFAVCKVGHSKPEA